jgi:hypothetical protein
MGVESLRRGELLEKQEEKQAASTDMEGTTFSGI